MTEPERERTIAGRFTRLRLAGSGGMGTVYRALDAETGGEVALKLLSASGGDHERFLLECSVLERLKHPAIVAYVDHGQTEQGEPYLAMEWLEGETLTARLERAPLSVPEAVTLGARVADALGLAHASGVIHRDLKPSNLFLCTGRVDSVKVLDFGVARLRENPQELTLTNQIVGTPGYMAPEQARGVRELDARADLFALGCVLYRAISGEPAFDGPDVLSVLAKLIMHRPPALAEIADGVPDELERLVICLLEKSPAQRPESAEAVRDELLRISALLEQTGSQLWRKRRSVDPNAATLSCVVLAQPTSADRTASGELDETLLARVQSEIASAGGRLQRLAGGALLVEVDTRGSAEDRAERAARCASVLDGALEGAKISIASGVMSASVRPEPSSTGALAASLEPARPIRARRAPWLALGALLAVGAAAAVLNAARSPASETPAVTPPSAAPAVSEPALTSKPLTVRVRISPPDASVTVDGKARALSAGELVLEGPAGQAFEVSVRSGDRKRSERIVIGSDGVASTSELALAEPAAKRAPSVRRATPAPAPSASRDPGVEPPPPKPPVASSAGPARETWD